MLPHISLFPGLQRVKDEKYLVVLCSLFSHYTEVVTAILNNTYLIIVY